MAITPESQTEPFSKGLTASRGRRARKVVLGVSVALLALLPAGAGGALVVKAMRDRVSPEVKVDGLVLHLDRASWIHDDMEHSERYPMPASMMPGMPATGSQRLHVEVTTRNSGRTSQTFYAEEMELRSEKGGVWPPAGGENKELRLDPGHAVTTSLYFDVPDTEPTLRLTWDRHGADAGILVTKPPVHKEEDLDEKVAAWPLDSSALPPGNPERGRQLFTGTFACVSCHGYPGAPGSNTVGPALEDIGITAATRIPEKSAPQYIYESILYPDAYITAICANNVPCTKPSKMPFYGELLSLQKMADLVAYLMTQRRAGAP